MSKKFSRRSDMNDFEDEYEYRSDYYQEIKDRRKNKRMRNALRSNNINDLMYDEDNY